MTMTPEKWNAMTTAERDAARSSARLSPQLVGMEGWRVEVEDEDGVVRRFIVSRSSGWEPCHLEIKRRNSIGGYPAARTYRRVTRLARVW